MELKLKGEVILDNESMEELKEKLEKKLLMILKKMVIILVKLKDILMIVIIKVMLF